MPAAAIASGAVESLLAAAGAELVVALVLTMAAATAPGVWAAAVPAAVPAPESACDAESSADLLEDLPADLPSPLSSLSDLAVEEVGLPLLAASLPGALESAERPGAAEASEFALEPVGVFAEASEALAEFDCGGELAGGCDVDAGCGAGG